MTVLKVEAMHCPHCVARIEKALSEAGLNFSVSLEKKTVTIDGCDGCVKKAVGILDDLGFDAVKA